MREMGLEGAVRGRRFKTTKPDSSGARPMDLVERDFNATRPNELWVFGPDLRCHVARLRVCRLRHRRLRSTHRRLASDDIVDCRHRSRCVEQALHERRLNPEDTLVHHSDRGVQYVSIRYTERLAEAGIEPSVGSRGDSYDHAWYCQVEVSSSKRAAR